MTEQRARQVAEAAQGRPLFAIVDGAASPSIVPRLGDLAATCLLPGKPAAVLRAAAPHLVQVSGDSPYLRWLLDEGWGRAWCVLLTSAEPLAAVAEHLRGLLRAKREDGSELHFRFHDPRILQAFLPTCTAEELKAFFGPVVQLFCEAEVEGDRWLESRLSRDQLVQRLLPTAEDADGRIVAALAVARSSEVGSRDLWVAAGGAAADVPRGLAAPARWAELWGRVRGQARVGLLRAALLAAPGDAGLLDALGRAATPPAALLAAAARCVAAWEAEAGEPIALLAPLNPSRDDVFVSLAPALQERLTAARRAALSAKLGGASVVDEARATLARLVNLLRDDAVPADRATAEVTAALARLHERATASPGPEAASIAAALAARRARLGERESSVRTLRAGILSLQVSLGLNKAGDSPSGTASAVAQGVLEALAATRPAAAPAPAGRA